MALVKAFKDAGWWVIAQDIDPYAAALKFADEIDTTDHIEKWEKAELIVPTRDAELREWAGKSPKVLVPSPATVDICTDKYLFYKWCKENGFMTPEVYFVKPRISKSGKETECVWQECVDGEEYSVDLFSDFEGRVISAVPRTRARVINGESWVSVTVRQERILSESVELALRLRLIGHNVLQCFLVNGEPVWTDVNARFGGASELAIQAGLKSPLWLAMLLRGEEVKPRLGEYEVGLRMLSYKESVYENVSHC